MSPLSADTSVTASDIPPTLRRFLTLAERDPRRVVRLVRSRYNTATATPEERLTLAWALLHWERVPEAVALLEGLYAHFWAVGQAELALLCRYGQLVARQLSGEGESLQAAWSDFIAECEAAGYGARAARARCEQIAHLNVLDRYPAARALADSYAEAVTRDGTPADLARYVHVAGVAATGCGDFTNALVLLDEAIERYRRARRPLGVARVLFERAWTAQRQQQYRQSREDLTHALRVFEHYGLPLRIALCRRDLGIAAAREGDLALSIAYTMQAREIFTSLGRTWLVAGIDLNLGTVAHFSGLFDLAEAAYERAHAVYVAAGSARLALISRRNQALAYFDEGRLDTALELAESLTAEAQAVGDPVEVVELLNVRGSALAGRDPAAALVVLEEARAHYSAMANNAGVADCRLNEGWLHLTQGDLVQAGACFEAAREALAVRPALLWRVYYGLGRLAAAAGREDEALAHYELAGTLVAEMRRGLASEHASSALFLRAGQLYTDALTLAARVGKTHLLLKLAEQQRALALRRQLVASFAGSSSAEVLASRKRLRTALSGHEAAEAVEAAMRDYVAALLHSRHRSLHPEQPGLSFRLEALRATLSAAYASAWTLLAPMFVDDEVLLVTVTPDELILERTPFDATLRGLIDRACLSRFRLHTYRDFEALRMGNEPSWATLTELGARLLPLSVRERLAPEHRLLIVPDGPLHALPWAALRIEGSWLVEQAVVELTPALAPLHLAEPALDAPALLVGCDTFDGRAAPLPLAQATLALAERRWAGESRRLFGPEATRNALLGMAADATLQTYGLVHVATHAHVGGKGLLAHIKLADDDLLADETLNFGLRECLVVLAACSGAAGEVLPGDEMLGVGRSLLAAGARAVVAGLWQVYDEGIVRMLDVFYEQLVGGADPALALAQAQRAQLTAVHADSDLESILRSPFVWGGLCVTSVSLARRL